MQPTLSSRSSAKPLEERSSPLEGQSNTLPSVSSHGGRKDNSQSILPTVAAQSMKRSRVSKDTLSPKRLKYTPTSDIPSQTSPRLTESNLNLYEEQYDDKAASFDDEVKSRATQEAGKTMGFNLKLECYEQPTVTSFMEWFDSQPRLFRERPIFKDSQDLIAMDMVAEAFDIGLHTGGLECQV